MHRTHTIYTNTWNTQEWDTLRYILCGSQRTDQCLVEQRRGHHCDHQCGGRVFEEVRYLIARSQVEESTIGAVLFRCTRTMRQDIRASRVRETEGEQGTVRRAMNTRRWNNERAPQRKPTTHRTQGRDVLAQPIGPSFPSRRTQ
jgi:hypothetical protein